MDSTYLENEITKKMDIFRQFMDEAVGHLKVEGKYPRVISDLLFHKHLIVENYIRNSNWNVYLYEEELNHLRGIIGRMENRHRMLISNNHSYENKREMG